MSKWNDRNIQFRWTGWKMNLMLCTKREAILCCYKTLNFALLYFEYRLKF